MEAAHLDASARAILASARAAQAEWAGLSVAARAERLRSAGRSLLEGAEELAELIRAETNKPLGESYSGDVLGVADLFEYWCAAGPAMLRPRRGAIPWLDMPGKSASIEREARGVIAVISPWNYPVALPMRVIVPALLAGNAVVLKPSEHTPRSGVWIIERLAAQLGAVVAVFEGAGEAGRALIAAGPDLVHFTGSTHTGRKVAVQCAEAGIPCETELGGKDCAVVLDDCAVERTAAGIAWGVVHNAGQDCASVERIVVHSRVADTFLPRLVAKMNVAASQVPELVTPRQREIVLAQLTDARDRGATFLCGGVPAGDGPIQPTLITGLPRDAAAWRDESFGPIAVVEVHDTDDALVAAANDTVFGLGGSVWGQDLRRAEAVARRLRTGMVWVNNHAFTGALPDLPWVGRGASGLGITSSPETLAHLTRPRLVVIDKSAALEPWWYPYGETLVDLMRVLIERKRVGGLGVTIRTLQTLSRRNKAVAAGEP
jgi:acyl-CoA reductase-like NAD-dependent aldehyde dehydrogenase